MALLKVIHLVEDLKVGGLERILDTIVRNLDKSKYQVEVWCLARGGAIAESLINDGYKVKILGIRSYYYPWNLLRLMWKLGREKPDILHTHAYFAGTAGRVAALFVRIKTLFHHMHSTYLSYKKRNLLIERLLSLFTSRIICCSNAVAEFTVNTEKIAPEKVTVIYNGVEILPGSGLSITQIKQQLQIDNNETVVGSIASLNPHKGHKYLVQAAVKVLEDIPNVKFILVGDGRCRIELETEAKELGIRDKIMFTGVRRDIYDFLSIMDIFVLPSSEVEGLGIALIEAMAMKKPVIGTELGGIPEVIQNNVNGFLVPPRNSGKMAEAIIRLLQDRSVAEEMGQKGYLIYKEKFLLSVMMEKVVRLYEEAFLKGQKRDV